MNMFFFYWIAFSIVILLLSLVVFFWTRKQGYYRNQDRARYLALWADMPQDEL